MSRRSKKPAGAPLPLLALVPTLSTPLRLSHQPSIIIPVTISMADPQLPALLLLDNNGAALAVSLLAQTPTTAMTPYPPPPEMIPFPPSSVRLAANNESKSAKSARNPLSKWISSTSLRWSIESIDTGVVCESTMLCGKLAKVTRISFTGWTRVKGGM